MASSAPTSFSSSPCAACKFLRRKCIAECIFAPYFPPEEPQKFASVHKIFGASNVTKLLNELLPHQREDAVNSLAYEAEARIKDPVYGCVGAISVLQRQVQRLQKELDAANSDLLRYACSEIPAGISLTAVGPPIGLAGYRRLEYERRGLGTFVSGNGDGGGFLHTLRGGTQPIVLPCHSSAIPWCAVAGNQQMQQNGGDLFVGMWVAEKEEESGACEDLEK